MSIEVELKIQKIPVLRTVMLLLKKVQLPGFEGLSLYDLIEMYLLGIIKGALSTRASAISFSLFTALFPLLIFMLTLVPYLIPYVQIGAQPFDEQLLVFMESFLPTATGEYFTEIFNQIKQQKQSGLLSTSFLVSIFLMANGVNAIFGGFENSYHTKLNRNFLKQYLYALAIGLLLSILFILGAIGFVYFEFYILDYLLALAKDNSYTSSIEDLQFVYWLKTLFFSGVFYLITAVLYFFGTAETTKTNFFSLGAFMTTVLFLLTSYFFGIYIDNFSTYNQLYGALGGLLILMFYIWINSNILLLGFELNMSLFALKNDIANPSKIH